VSKGKREEITVLTFSTPLESAGHRFDVDTVAGGHKVEYFQVDVIAWLSVQHAWNILASVRSASPNGLYKLLYHRIERIQETSLYS
jgi:hypothetical protein